MELRAFWLYSASRRVSFSVEMNARSFEEKGKETNDGDWGGNVTSNQHPPAGERGENIMMVIAGLENIPHIEMHL